MAVADGTEVLVIVPTYNEARNVHTLLDGLVTEYPQVQVLVVDDGSPDGTANVVHEHPEFGNRIHLLSRTAKTGLGRAYLAGFAWGLERGFTYLVEMDADLSHRVQDLAVLLRSADAADVVQGSRWVPGGGTRNWPWYRKLISRGGSTYARIMLGLGVKDVTGGFRLYRATLLRELKLDNVESAGYCFQIDMLRRVASVGAKIVECPIIFVERTHGSSKMTSGIVLEAMSKVTVWGVRRLFGKH